MKGTLQERASLNRFRRKKVDFSFPLPRYNFIVATQVAMDHHPDYDPMDVVGDVGVVYDNGEMVWGKVGACSEYASFVSPTTNPKQRVPQWLALHALCSLLFSFRPLWPRILPPSQNIC